MNQIYVATLVVCAHPGGNFAIAQRSRWTTEHHGRVERPCAARRARDRTLPTIEIDVQPHAIVRQVPMPVQVSQPSPARHELAFPQDGTARAFLMQVQSGRRALDAGREVLVNVNDIRRARNDRQSSDLAMIYHGTN